MTFRIFCAFCLLCAGILFADEPYIGYSEYQIVTDTSFSPLPYFQQMQSYGVNLQRIWVLGLSNTVTFRELMPFKKSRGIYNLNQLNPDYLQRLRTTMKEAEENGQKVLLTLFDRWSMARPADFSKTPWYYKNNTDELLKSPFPATAEFHPIYEIMNEARWPRNCEGLTEFHDQVAAWIQEIDPGAMISVNIQSNCSNVYNHDWVGMISFHYDDWKDGICETISKYRDLQKPILIDTDGAWKIRNDNNLVTSWLQETLSCGGWFNHKDDIYHLDTELLQTIHEERQVLKNSQTQNTTDLLQ
jgi:hypothetical protein